MTSFEFWKACLTINETFRLVLRVLRPETRLTVYRSASVKSNTGTVVASWDPRRRATIGDFDKKNKGFDENHKHMSANIFFSFSLICFDKFHIDFQKEL